MKPALALLLLCLPAAVVIIGGQIAQPQPHIVGRVTVTDGDSLRMRDGRRIRLFGIDAPELDQTCQLPSGKIYPCGINAKEALRRLVGDEEASCLQEDTDQYKRIVAVCTILTEIDIGAEMVVQGLAIAYRRFSQRYVPLEEKAKKERRGIWNGTFEQPEDFRRRRPWR